MDLAEKLEILADSAKYDVACTSSGVGRPGRHGSLGSCAPAGICHAFTPDGRCVSLLKVLYSNVCSYDCSYCVNRRSNDRPRATFTPRELAELTIGFYRRNYIEGLFLSSAVLGTPDRTMELMIEALRILREEYRFNGYIHAKTIPGADPALVEKIGLLADRLSVNIELPSEASLNTLAPDKKKTAILRPMGQIAVQSAQSKKEMVLYRGAKAFAPAGQSTQMIIGATPETDRHIMDLTLLRFARLCFEQGPRAAQMLGNPDAAAAFALERAVSNEACKCIEFIRFEQRDDMLGAVIHPKHQVLPLLRGHFCSRLPDDDFLIFDATHGTALVRRSGRVQYLTMERYTPGTNAGELDWQRLWKRFFKALTIEERRNEKAQMNHVQKRFWKDMVEMQGDLPSP